MGYVLYGDKPICIEGYYLQEDSETLSEENVNTFFLIKGIELWQQFKISPLNKNYIFLIFDVDYGYRHLVCINRKAFIKAVSKNLSLFRYVLGPKVTPENLLDELINHKDKFYQILKNDNVLLGILLGYGTQNALLVSRDEDISDAFESDREDFPFLSRKERKRTVDLPKFQKKRPSFGYFSLNDEIKDLNEAVIVSRELKPFKNTSIPYFGCEPASNESKQLLDLYEKNRATILQVLEKDDFLEKTLQKLFTTTSNILEIPTIRPISQSLLSHSKEKVLSKLIEIIHEDIKNDPHFCEDFLKAFFDGVVACKDQSKKPLSTREFLDTYCKTCYIFSEFREAESLDKAECYFQKLSLNPQLQALIPYRLYYETLIPGAGLQVSSKTQYVSFHFSFCTIGGQYSDFGTVKGEKIEHLIPGVSRSLIGMKRGEKRKLFIHPEYAYGTNSYLLPNLMIEGVIELLDFSEGTQEVVLPKPHKLKRHNGKELLEKSLKLKREEYFSKGLRFWSFITKNKELADFDTFTKLFNAHTQKKPSFDTDAQKNLFLIDIYSKILLDQLPRK